MEGGQLVKVDLLDDSRSHLLTVCFAKSSSSSYPLALQLAKGAAKYNEAFIGKTLFHSAAFAKTRTDAALALSVIHYVKGWRATGIYAGGKILQNTYRTSEVLKCFLEATACHDWTAHCHIILNDPFFRHPLTDPSVITLKVSIVQDPFQSPSESFKAEIKIDRYTFPCTYLNRYSFRFQTDHPADPRNQIQAKAVEIGCDWCPKFDPNSFKKIGRPGP